MNEYRAAAIANRKRGKLHKVDHINCRKCRNKGWIYIAVPGNDVLYVKECSCMKRRREAMAEQNNS